LGVTMFLFHKFDTLSFISTAAGQQTADTAPTTPGTGVAQNNANNTNFLLDESANWNTVEKLIPMYRKYKNELAELRKIIDALCPGTKDSACISTDLEMEMHYMRIREGKPRIILEMCSNAGFSTHWILFALKKNGRGRLIGFDFNKKPNITGGLDLGKERYIHVQGDMYENFGPTVHPIQAEVDYVYIDGAHNREQGEWFAKNVLNFFVNKSKAAKQAAADRGTDYRRVIYASTHDVYNIWYTAGGMTKADPSIEGILTTEWIALSVNAVYNVFQWARDKPDTLVYALNDGRVAELGWGCDKGKERPIVKNGMRGWCTVLTMFFQIVV